MAKEYSTTWQKKNEIMMMPLLLAAKNLRTLGLKESVLIFCALLPGNAQNKIYVRGDNFMFS